MQRAPRSQLEAWFVANLYLILPLLLGEPESDDGREFVFRDYVGKVAVTYDRTDPGACGAFIRRHDGVGGAGFDMLLLFGLTEADVQQVKDELRAGDEPPRARSASTDDREAKSASAFAEIMATARDDDGRIKRYLAARGLDGFEAHVKLVTLKGGRRAMAALAVDGVIGDPIALQALELDSVGRPAQVNGKKVRRTYTSIKGWSHDAAFRLDKLPDGSPEVVMVEGTEDAMSVRKAGWTGAVVAVLGKGNIARHSPAGMSVILCFDGDVEQHEVDDAVEEHKRANRTVRLARMPTDVDPNDMIREGRGDDLLAIINGAETSSSKVVELEKELLRFPFDMKGHARYLAERREIAKRFQVSVKSLDEMRARLARLYDPGFEADSKELVPDIEPAAHPVDSEELFDKLVGELTDLVVFDKTDNTVPAGAVASALWVITTHTFEKFPKRGESLDDIFDHAPRLMISAGTIRSGKTRLLDTVACLGRRVLRASSLSASALFRVCERCRPLVLLDEVDQARLHEEGNGLIQLINDGFEPNGAAIRVGGDKNERIDVFRTFMPVALCGIGRLPSATEDRSIRLVLVRKPETRKTSRLNKAKKKKLREIAPEILRWVKDNWLVLIQNLEPDMPPGVENDRDEDLWRPLLAIADTMGGKAPDLARKAMMELIDAGHDQSPGEELMTAIFSILSLELIDNPTVTKISLQRLVGLVNHREGHWSDHRGGVGCDSRWLGKKVKEFGLVARKVRDAIHGEKPTLGYDIHELLKLAHRYRAKEEPEPAEEKRDAPSGNAATGAAGATNSGKSQKANEKFDAENVAPDEPVARASRATDQSRPRVNPITGKPSKQPVADTARATRSSDATDGSAKSSKKAPASSTAYENDADDVASVAPVPPDSEGAPTFFNDPIPGVDEPLPIDLTKLDPEDLLPAEMRHYGYTVGPAPTFRVILPPDIPDDDPAAYDMARRLANEHRAIAWRRLQAKKGDE